MARCASARAAHGPRPRGEKYRVTSLQEGARNCFDSSFLTPRFLSLPVLQIFGDRYVDIIRIILSVIIPPVGVFLQVGFGAQLWINILLTILGYVPGVIHALYIILSR